jgi:hypothetical protein
MMAMLKPSRRALAAAVREMVGNLAAQPGDALAHLLGDAGRQVLVGKVDRRSRWASDLKPRVRQSS